MKPDLEIKVNCFNLKDTLECGQCFRWKCIDNNVYVGVIQDRVVKLEEQEGILRVWSNETKDLKEVIFEYLDLNTDYLEIEESIRKIDKNINKAVDYSSGIHILNQPLFETIISYVISANNNIKRISKSVNDISKKYGKKVLFENEEYYLFPTLEEIKNVTIDDLLECGTGFRARYIKKDIELLNENIELLEVLKKSSTMDAKEILLKFQGIGPKVADCILLFSLKRKEVFPVDVWVKRIMEKVYFKENTSLKEIEKYAKENFGQYAGIIQQHLFHNVREGNL